VLGSNEKGMRGMTVRLTDLQTGISTLAITNSFGFYTFDEVQPSHTYMLAVISSKRLNIVGNYRTIVPLDNLIGVNFTIQAY